MRLFGRHDTPLAAALIVATFILFREPLQFLLDAAHEVERQYHLDLERSLIVLGVVFLFHQYRKRQEAKADFLGAAAEATQARLRSEELQRLVGFSRALAMSTDFTGLHSALSRYLPQFAQDRPCWLLICQQSYWDVLVRGSHDQRPPGELEAIAERALVVHGERQYDAEPVRIDGLACFSMLVGGHPVGMILVSDTPALEPNACRTVEAAAVLAAVSVRNVQTLLETREQSLRDGLTGCFNRAHALETIDSELRRAHRSGTPLSMIMFDVDRFKSVNDTHGHLAGDRVLAEVGKRLTAVLRTSDVKCRYGGDEFLLILPDTPPAGVRQLAESIRNEVANISVAAGDSVVKVTASLGVVTARSEERTATAFVARADEALYRAKHLGRNRVHVGDDSVVAALRLVGQTG